MSHNPIPESSRTCIVCTENFESKSMARSRTPRVLPGCGHSLCTSCISKILTSGANLNCPLDRIPFPRAAQISDFPINYGLVDLLDSVADLEAKQSPPRSAQNQYQRCEQKEAELRAEMKAPSPKAPERLRNLLGKVPAFTKSVFGRMGQFVSHVAGLTSSIFTPILGSRVMRTVGQTGFKGSSNSQLNQPRGVCVSDSLQQLFIADSSNHRVQVFDVKTGNYVRTFGETVSAGSSNRQFDHPVGVCVSESTQQIFVADCYNDRVQVFNVETGNYVRTLGGRSFGLFSVLTRHFDYPSAVCVSESLQQVFVADEWNHRVQVFDLRNGRYVRTLGQTASPGLSNSHFNHPKGLSVSESLQQLFVVDCDNHRVQVFNLRDGSYVRTLGDTGCAGSSNSRFNHPSAVCVSESLQQVVVTDLHNHRVQVIDLRSGRYVRTLRQLGKEASGLFSGVCVSESSGQLFVSDWSKQHVQAFQLR